MRKEASPQHVTSRLLQLVGDLQKPNPSKTKVASDLLSLAQDISVNNTVTAFSGDDPSHVQEVLEAALSLSKHINAIIDAAKHPESRASVATLENYARRKQQLEAGMKVLLGALSLACPRG